MGCVKISISGLVQGVGFRYATMRKARELNIKGFVKNEYNGTVYIEACADDAKLNLFINWCHRGPLHASVSLVDTDPLAEKVFGTFEIR